MKLADIIDTFITGDWGEESPTQDTPNAAYCVRGADIVPITNHNFTDIPQRYVCDRTKETKLLAAGDLVIEKSGGSPTQSTGRIVYVSEDLIKAKGNVVCSNFCTAFRVKAGWNPLYVYYFWQNVYNHGAFFNFEGKTSGIKNLQLDNALSAIDIEYLPLEKQNQIVASLASIDEKIKVNRQINDNLEAMAKQLYDYWFVQFDFPNEEGKPYKSSGGAMAWNERLKREIPIGWTCCSIKEMCDINKKTINKDEHKQIEYLDTGSITQGHISNTEIYSVDMAPSRAQRKVEDLSILYSSVRPRLLHYGILSTPNENFIVSTGFVTLDAKCKKMALMVYYFLTSNTITEHLASIADTAVSSYPSISPDDIAYLDIVIPSNDIIQKYNDIVEPMFRKMSTLRKEIDSLTKQRDELLPLLMNGQASVNYHLSDD
ncbi:restriction endonuclease subunit S [Bacteroides faecis]|uniref:restriction endonuclease subunit S n=1 Tax=Bacteroides faecis TaxID=674529 RepID=UPI002164B56D|nr:restriction endonuclease subunit S [Bacteroides faecis]MCS2935092.1 restriction endonuclease subunit S [Bacteroides faecis]UVS50525.1 restriction endonuclease subunit S [Bacteroides faecis]